MGEQSKESETDEAASYDPFIRSKVEYDASTRLLMAENAASTRRLMISPMLKEIIVNPENFYHDCQQSFKMTENANRRRQMSYNTKREAYIQLRRTSGLPLPSKIQMIEINPTRVTLSLEFESQYYSLMTNDYGMHENVASIMNETNTIIQLPDRCVEGTHPDPFAQQITITGHCSDIDTARKLMRQNCHVSIFMSLSKMRNPATDIHTFVTENPIQNVDISSIESPPDKNGKGGSYLRFTSREKNLPTLINAAKQILQKFDEDQSSPADIFSLHFTLTTYHVEQIVGTAATGYLMPKIENVTHTKINIPSNIDTCGDLIVIEITGAVENILEARKCIMELLPVSLSCNFQHTDMLIQCPEHERKSTLILPQYRTMFKMYYSEFEPNELLSEEVAINFGSFRSREFNIKQVYAAYQQFFSPDLGIVAPLPTDHESSIWHKCLPHKFFEYCVPCRGDSEAFNNARRKRSTSVTSLRAKQSQPNKGNSGSGVPGNSQRYQTRVSSVSESSAQPLPSFPDPHFAQMMLMNQACMKGTQLLIPYPPGIVIVNTSDYLPSCPENLAFDAFNRVSFPVIPINEVPQPTCRPESSNSMRPTNSNRNTTPNMNRPSSAGTIHNQSPSHRHRVYEKVRDDDVRNSPRHGPRRPSVNQEEHSAEQYDERSSDRQYQRQYPRYSHNEPRWKTGGRGDIHSKRNGPFHKEYRGPPRDQDFNDSPSAGTTERAPSVDNSQFQSTHHLKLKPNEIDLEHERLFTHDSPQIEQLGFTSGGYGNELMDGDYVQRLLSNATLNDPGKRSRAASCFIERDDQSSKFTDSDCAQSVNDFATQPSRSIDSIKRVPGGGVSKTMLEPRSRNERDYGKISLEHKDKHFIDFNDGEKFVDVGPTFGMRQYRMDPMKLIASVRESSEQLPRIHERQFSDVLNDKERELAAFRERNSETTVVQDPSLDESSSMNYAFRNEHSPGKQN
ncbi:CBN-GLD-3 protein [Caenorhabditis brenneri]|uniref:CBN-GLD-3 protein n=2 Tax=Caenorhabditis brenneri TaxID=135651 RepID=G0N9S0_CAEBE|nr:CBN-GLD-3 protein [Caenorhabditis brenneri]